MAPKRSVSSKIPSIKPIKMAESNLRFEKGLKSSKQRAQSIVVKDDKQIKWEPKNWKPMWEGIQNSRKKILAPVDGMGCDELSLKKDKKSLNQRAYHNLVGLMLSAQTKDEVTHATTRYLIEEQNLSIETILKTEEKVLNKWIQKVGFHNTKAKHIKMTT